MLEELLRNPELFEQVAANPDKFGIDINADPMQKYSPAQRWNIFSRIRFEYVRPTCTLRQSSLGIVAPTMDEEALQDGLLAYVIAALNPNLEAIAILRSAIENPIPESVGEYLGKYYQSGVPVPGDSISTMFPASYIIPHDLHHVLLDLDTSQKSEMLVLAFEEGMLLRTEFPILLFEQLEIFLKEIPANAKELMKYWNQGVRCPNSLLDDWPWTKEIDLNISDFRAKYL